jgi:formate dehydrogenase subunit gamma
MRYSFSERLMHSSAAVSYVYLLLSGLAFWSPAFYWIAAVLGGGFLARAMHPWVGVVFATVATWMLFKWSLVMRPTDDDRAWRKAMWHYIRNEDDRVPQSNQRFNFGQKMQFWVMTISACVLLLSGLVLWFPHTIPGSASIVREMAILVHVITALVTIGAFIIHVYMGVVVVPNGQAIVIGGSTDAPTRPGRSGGTGDHAAARH